MFKLFNICEPCCCPTVGYEALEIPAADQCCKPHYGSITYLYNFDGTALREKLDECVMVFMGPTGTCDFNTNFDDDQIGIIATWINEGGRVYLASEYIGCMSHANVERQNEIIGLLGSSMSIGEKACNCGCFSQQWTGSLNLSVPMIADCTAIHCACTNEVIGGTWLAKTITEGDEDGKCYDPYPYIAMEKIGDGYLIVSGDSNITTGCGYDNCCLFRNFIQNSDEDMLGDAHEM